MSSRGQTCNEVIDAANGDGDAADDPASAGGEVASGVAALAVRLRYRLRPGHRDIQFIGGACLRWTCIARQAFMLGRLLDHHALRGLLSNLQLCGQFQSSCCWCWCYVSGLGRNELSNGEAAVRQQHGRSVAPHDEPTSGRRHDARPESAAAAESRVRGGLLGRSDRSGRFSYGFQWSSWGPSRASQGRRERSVGIG